MVFGGLKWSGFLLYLGARSIAELLYLRCEALGGINEPRWCGAFLVLVLRFERKFVFIGENLLTL